MGKKVGVIICNWNKKEYLLKCIESVQKSSFNHFDIYVVDNGSTDGSADEVERLYADNVMLIRKSENTGGAGGFNTGINKALEKEYDYLYLLDNDVVIEKDALLHLYYYLEENKDVGIVGSKILYMENPDIVQYLGAQIDWENFSLLNQYLSHPDTEEIPLVLETDMIPACSLLVRTQALRAVGGIDPNYFIYFDDIDMCYAIKSKGYNLSIYTRSIVWHKRGRLDRSSTFGDYYVRRNSFYFFLKYCAHERIPALAEKLLETMFKEFYLGTYNERYEVVRTRLYAIDDLINGIRGPAREGRIVRLPEHKSRLIKCLSGRSKIAIIDYGSALATKLSEQLLKEVKCTEIIIVCDSNDEIMPDSKPVMDSVRYIGGLDYKKDDFEVTIQTCPHVCDFHQYEDYNADIYVDNYSNIICGDEDRLYIANYKRVFESYRELNKPVLEQKLRELKNNM